METKQPRLQAYSVGDEVPPGRRRLHLNEFRYEHAPAVLAALARAAVGPDASARLLTDYQAGPDPALLSALEAYLGLPSESILVAPGSDEVLRAIIDTCGLRGHRSVVMGVPGYTHFEHFARLRGLEVTPYSIGLRTSSADHEAALRYHAPQMRTGCLVYLCSPNNPTGDTWSWPVVDRLAREFPSSLFLLDEAYVEFASAEALASAEGAPEGRSSGAATAARPAARSREEAAAALNRASVAAPAAARPNIIVTRTMSKAFGLAAMRIGYAVGAPELLRSVRVAVSPKAFWPLAADAAVAALQECAHYLDAAVAARREARRVVAELARRGWWAADTPANFYLVWAGAPGPVVEHLQRAGVQIRNRHALPGLAGFVRLTAGTPEDSQAVLDAFLGLAPPAGVPPQALYTNKGRVARVKGLLRDCLQILEASRVTVWAQSGTLLGALRHSGMIPVDDDADLAYLLEPGAPDPMRPLVGAFRRAGLALQRNRTDAYWQVGTNAAGELISPEHVDLFPFSPEAGGTRLRAGDPRFALEDPASPEAHCNPSYEVHELFPLRRCAFHDFTLNVPAASATALARALGPDFMEVMRARPSGGRGGWSIPLEDFSPA